MERTRLFSRGLVVTRSSSLLLDSSTRGPVQLVASFRTASSFGLSRESPIPQRRKGRTKWKGGVYVPKDKLFDTTPPIKTLADPTTGWNQFTKRCGVIALKIGMTSEFSEYYEYMPLTVLQILDCQVVQVKTHNQKEGEVSIQVGADNAKLWRVTKPLRGHFLRHGVPPKRVLMEFKISDKAQLRPGTELRAEHFVPGQYLDLTGVSIGKGFQGVMKRWGFKGGRASHGNSKTHRQMGSTGQHSNPSRVFPGKKMPGHMGNKTSTVKNLMLWKIDTRLNLLYVRGSIPGSRNKYVRVKDAKNKYQPMVLPFPTYVRKPGEVLPEIVTANLPQPSWYKNMEARRVMYAEDPAKNRDDDSSALKLIQKYKEEFPSYDKWKKGLLPGGRNPSDHPSCASAGVTLQIPWLTRIVQEVQATNLSRRREAAEKDSQIKSII